jgi:hypothetical protein
MNIFPPTILRFSFDAFFLYTIEKKNKYDDALDCQKEIDYLPSCSGNFCNKM